MPTIKEKLSYEQQNERTIRLWPEGGFYKAYERSAYLFVNYVRPYEVRSKFVKVVGGNVIDIGFPKSVLQKLDMTVDEQGDGCMVLRLDKTIDEQTYMIWRESVPKAETALIEHQAVVKATGGVIASSRKGLAPTAILQGADCEHAVAERIRRLNLADITPMKCMALLSELQQQLR